MMIYDNDEMKVFSENLLDIASECIPMTSTKSSKKSKPWFDADCKNAIKKRNAAYRRYQNNPDPDNAIRVRLFRAKCRRTIKSRKRASWRQYVSSINSNTPIKKVWTKIRKITGKTKTKVLQHVKDKNGQIVTGTKEVANALGEQFQNSSSSSNYSPDFQLLKNKEEKTKN